MTSSDWHVARRGAAIVSAPMRDLGRGGRHTIRGLFRRA